MIVSHMTLHLDCGNDAIDPCYFSSESTHNKLCFKRHLDLFSWRSQSQIACDMDKVKVSDNLDATEQV